MAAHSFCSLLVRNLIPGLVWIETLDLPGDLRRIGAEVLLIDRTVMADEEGLYARFAIARRPRNQCISCNHIPIDHIVISAASHIAPLPGENAESITEIALVRGSAGFSEFCLDHKGSGGAFSIVIRRPIKPVMRALGAHELLREFEHIVIVAVLTCIVLLRQDVVAAALDGGELVFAYAPVQNLFKALLGVELPALVALHQRKGKWPQQVAQQDF